MLSCGVTSNIIAGNSEIVEHERMKVVFQVKGRLAIQSDADAIRDWCPLVIPLLEHFLEDRVGGFDRVDKVRHPGDQSRTSVQLDDHENEDDEQGEEAGQLEMRQQNVRVEGFQKQIVIFFFPWFHSCTKLLYFLFNLTNNWWSPNTVRPS